MNEIIQQIKEIIVKNFEIAIKPEQLTDTQSLLQDGLGFDSVFLVEFLSLIEEHFNIEFIDDELVPESFNNIKTIAEIISKKI